MSYDYVDARNAITDTPLLRRAKQQVKYQLDWQLYDFDWGITYQYLGTRYDKDYSSYPYQTVKMGGVSLWDLAVAYPVTSHLTVRGKIANLFDKDYETVLWLPNCRTGIHLVWQLHLLNHVPTVLVFDSGVGGLSVYDEIRHLLPDFHYIYAFDNVAFPVWRKKRRVYC